MKRSTGIIFLSLVLFIAISVHFIDSTYAGSISWGAKGEEVRQVQDKLKRWGYYDGEVDGVYGSKTYRAVTSFQKKNGLTVDGKVGSETKKALGIFTGTTAGKYNQTVRNAQQKLKQWGYYTGSVDGIYGSKTREAVLSFQRKNNLTADGVIGPKTRAALGIEGETVGGTYSATSRGVSRDKDIRLIAMAINGEARGEPYTGQVAVGAVILNRVRHPSFPNTIAGVIYQPLAFTAVADGQIYLDPNESAYKAARDALNGWDPTGGAIYYWNPVTATSEWIWTRTPSVKIGKHWFAKK